MGKKSKQEPVKVPVVYIPHADSVCSDCGKKGCWIPIPHKQSDLDERKAAEKASS